MCQYRLKELSANIHAITEQPGIAVRHINKTGNVRLT